MDNRRSSRESLVRRWQALVEQYTPDGALGRSLVGSATGVVGLWLLAAALFEVPRWGASLAALFWFPALLGAGLPVLALSLLVLWPVYLSLIGNVDSTEEYSVPDANTSETPTTAATEPATETPLEPDADDPFTDLKRKYANGELSEDEFERRVEARLRDADRSTTDETTRRTPSDEPARERNTDRR